jgi:hypothetical protein
VGEEGGESGMDALWLVFVGFGDKQEDIVEWEWSAWKLGCNVRVTLWEWGLL